MENGSSPCKWIDTNITGRKFNSDEVNISPFMAGSLRELILSDKFQLAPQEIRRKIQHLSFLMHVVTRFDNFKEVYKFNLKVLGDIEARIATWEDNVYFEEEEGKYLCDLLKGEETKADVVDLVVKKECNGEEKEHYDIDIKADIDYLSDKSWDNDNNDENFYSDKDFDPGTEIKKEKVRKERIGCPLSAKCKFTAKRFTSKGLIKHFNKKHNPEEKELTCEKCGQVFKNIVKLSKHVESHKDKDVDIKEEIDREEFCHECNCMIKIIGKDSMVKHANTFHKQKASCPYCQKMVFSEKVLLTHIKKQHSNLDNSETLLCSKCGFSTDNIGEYTQHKMTHNESSKCNICEKTFASISSLKQHNKYSHPNGTDIPRESEVCPHCGKSYKHMAFHIYKVHSNNSHKCPECDYTSPLKALVKVHYRGIHQQILSTCEDCGKVVKKIGHHKLRGCPARKKKPKLDCSHCDKKFSLPEGLRRHVKNIHLNIKDKACPHCDYRTAVGFNLRIHITRVHEGKQFKTTCQYCGKNVNSLEWHIKTYHIREYLGNNFNYDDVHNLDNEGKGLNLGNSFNNDDKGLNLVNNFNNDDKGLIMLKQ